ncbi:MAG: hypothetical protein AAB445_02325 [Patescibacteria group bacterium]
MTSLYILSRRFHRYLVLIILGLTLVMAGTGFFLRYPSWSVWLPSWLDMGKVRYLHGQVSTYFAITLVIMVLTGSYMYFHTLWVQRKQEKIQKQNPPPPPVV